MLSQLLKEHITVDINKMRVDNFIENQNKIELAGLQAIKNGHGWKKIENCPVCGSLDFSEEFKVHGNMLRNCRKCNLRYHEKIPNDFNDVYQAEDYTTHGKGETDIHFNYRKERFGRERVGLLKKYCGGLSNKKLLDVGCGMGDFLDIAKEYLHCCIGSEYSNHLRDYAKEKTGLKIYSESLDKFPENEFDIITSFDVIEHVPEPLKFIKDATKLLNKGGYILLYTPNFDSLSIKILRDESNLLNGIGHIQIFSHKSLKVLGELSGLSTIHTETHGLDINSIISFLSYKNNDNSFLIKWKNELQAIIDKAEAADYLRIIYKKN